MYKLTLPVGMEPLSTFLDTLSENQSDYRFELMKIPSLVLPLNHGEGRTRVLDYVTDRVLAEMLRPIRSPRENVEFTLDGSVSQLREVFDEIRSEARFVNSYSGIVGLGIEELKSSDVRRAFLDCLGTAGDQITYIFFTQRCPPESLVTYLRDEVAPLLDGIEFITLRPYSEKDLCLIAMSQLQELTGIEEGPRMTVVRKLIREAGCVTPRDTLSVARKLSSRHLGRTADYRKEA